MGTVREHFYKPFSVNGESVTAEHIAAVEPVLRGATFRFFDVGKAMIQAGVSYANHDQAADRFLQRARKLGLVEAKGPAWRTQPHMWAAIDRPTP
jgi:hypothetical protein